jgi:hypothetical protein
MLPPPSFSTEKSIRNFENWGRIISDAGKTGDQVDGVFDQIIELLRSTKSENMSMLIQLIGAHMDLERLFTVRGKNGLFAHALLEGNFFDYNNPVDYFALHLLRRVNETDDLGNSVLFLLIKSELLGYNIALEAVRGDYADLSLVDDKGRSVLHLAAEFISMIPEQNIPDYRLLHAILDKCLLNPDLSHLVSDRVHRVDLDGAPEENSDEDSVDNFNGTILREDSEEDYEEDSEEDSEELVTDPLLALLDQNFFIERLGDSKLFDLSLFSKFLKLMPNKESWARLMEYMSGLQNKSDLISIYLGLYNNLLEWTEDPENVEYILRCRNSSGMSILDWFLKTEVPCPEPCRSNIILCLIRIGNLSLLRNSYREVTPLFRMIKDYKNWNFSPFLLKIIIESCDSEILSHRSKFDESSEKWESALGYLIDDEDDKDDEENFFTAQEIIKNPNWNPAGENYDTLCRLIGIWEFWRFSPEKREASIFQIAKVVARSSNLNLGKWGIDKNLEVLRAALDNFSDQIHPDNLSAIEAAILQIGG